MLSAVALFVVYHSLASDDIIEEVKQYSPQPNYYGASAPAPGTAGNTMDDGDQDASDYEYDPLHGDDPMDPADSAPDVEGQAPPTPKWHACRFQAKKGGIYDLRPLMRLAKSLEEDWIHVDAIHTNTTYYMNVCANTMAVPQACQSLAKHDPSPAFQVSDNGNCYYLGTLKTFKWKPIDPTTPAKGMKLFYQNGERCLGSGRTRQIMYSFACSEYFTYADGPLVVYETVSGCHYDVHWPNRAGCPTMPLMHRLKSPLTEADGGLSGGGVFIMVLMVACCLYVCGGCWYRRTKEGADGIEACPHHQFWCALPAIFMGGFQSLAGKVTGAQSTKGFQRVPTGPTDYGSSTMGARDDMF